MRLLVVEDDGSPSDASLKGLTQEGHVVGEGFDTQLIPTVRGVGYRIKA